jgi:hypothetical protein
MDKQVAIGLEKAGNKEAYGGEWPDHLKSPHLKVCIFVQMDEFTP